MSNEPAAPSQSAEPGDPAGIQPLRVDTPHIITVGLVLWAVALVVSLVVPALHSADRDWWPWAALAGLVLGALGMTYVRRGRGNASAA